MPNCGNTLVMEIMPVFLLSKLTLKVVKVAWFVFNSVFLISCILFQEEPFTH